MAAHDGVPVAVVHIHGAANRLQVELLTARDRLIHAPAATSEPPAPPAATAKVEKPAPKPVAAKPAEPKEANP